MDIRQVVTQYQGILQRELAAGRQRLVDYQADLAGLTERLAQIGPGSSRPLTVPAIFRRSYDENIITDYLAYVLDPARNGIGEAPLVGLLKLCGLDSADLPVSEVVVHREYPLGKGRIDLLLEWEETLVLGIENKVFACENPGQTEYYAREILRLFEEIPAHLVYLTRGGQEPESTEFHPVSYRQLLDALRGVHIEPDADVRRRVLWQDFLEHVEEYIVMSELDHFEFSEKAMLYLEHRAMIRDLDSAFKREWAEALRYLEQQVYAQLRGAPWKTLFNPPSSTWHQVFKSSWNQPELSVHYEYHLSQSRFHRGRMAFYVDVERSRADEYLELFDQRYPALEGVYKERGMLYRPPLRTIAISWKEYPISQDIEEVANVFISALDEHRFLESEIDAVLAMMEMK